MEKSKNFLLPPPNFGKPQNAAAERRKPYYLTPSGMTLLPREKQPPPMYGPRGATVPAKYLRQQFREQKPPERCFCETCDVECGTKEELRCHRSQHERCPVDGCGYSGHPSVMDKHVTTLHASGLFENFKKLSTPEEIAAWREERRKKYPTVANVQMRQQAQEQRQKRGERLEANNSRFGKPEDRRRVPAGNNSGRATNAEAGAPGRTQNNQRNKWKEKRMRKQENTRREKPAATVTQSDELNKKDGEDIPTCCNIPMFRGTSRMKDYKHQMVRKPRAMNALTSLLGMYGSEDDEEEEEEEEKNESSSEQEQQTGKVEMIDCEVKAQDSVLPQVQIIAARLTDNDAKHSGHVIREAATSCHNGMLDAIAAPECSNMNASKDSSDEAPEETPIARSSDLPVPTDAVSSPHISHGPPTKRAKPGPSKPLKVVRRLGLDYRKSRQRKQNTMLEKLLEPDIRHERNVLLQCVRYVCENNFFGVGASKPQTKPS